MAHILMSLAFLFLVCPRSEAQVAPEADRGRQASASERSRQENDFSNIIKRRDDQIAARAEVQRIINFANGAASRVNRFFDSLPSVDFASDLNRRIQVELSRLDRVEAALPGPAQTRRGGTRTAELGGGQVPLPADPASPLRANSPEPTFYEFTRNAIAAFHDYNHGVMMAELRTSLLELRQNLSQKHMYWASDFEGFMSGWEQQLRKAAGAGAVDLLRRAPSLPIEGNGPRDQGAATDEQARSSTAKYRELLRAASDSLRDRPTHAEVRRAMLADINGFGEKIKAVGVAYDNDIQDVERSIVKSASDIFGSNVNSNVFLWLLAAFAGIFLLIMIGPRFYAQTTVAENLLKAEFLLQFSTVFILTAAIIILGIGQFIDRDQLPVLLAGISGYVLGQLGKPGADIVRHAPSLARVAGFPNANPENDNPPPGDPRVKPAEQPGAPAPGSARSTAASA